MATMKDVFEKLGLNVTGLVKSVDEYVSSKDPAKPKSYWSVTLDVGGKTNVKINLPDNYPRQNLPLYEVVSVKCGVSVFNNQMRLDAL